MAIKRLNIPRHQNLTTLDLLQEIITVLLLRENIAAYARANDKNIGFADSYTLNNSQYHTNSAFHNDYYM